MAGLLGCVGSVAFAEPITFHLSTGERVSGEILRQTPESVVLSNSWAGEITVPQRLIISREGVTNAATPAVASTPAPKPAPPPPPPAPPPKPKAPPPAPNLWKGEAQLGMDLLFGARDRQIAFTRFRLDYTRPYPSEPKQYFKNTFDISAEYGKTDGEKSSERLFASDKVAFDLEHRWYVYALVAGGHDYRLRIDLQYEAGPGAGYHLVNRPKLTLNLEGGVNYQYQLRRSDAVFDDRYEVQDVYYRVAQDFSWKPGRFSISERLEVFPRGNFEDLRARFETTFSYELWKNLALNLTVLDLYDTEPANNVNNNELQIRSSLGLKF